MKKLSDFTLSIIPLYKSTWTTCSCGKSVELKINSMGWKTAHCMCGTKIRLSKCGGTMIVEK